MRGMPVTLRIVEAGNILGMNGPRPGSLAALGSFQQFPLPEDLSQAPGFANELWMDIHAIHGHIP